MRPLLAGSVFKSFPCLSIAMLAIFAGPPASARGGYHRPVSEALSPPACGVVGGSLADPEQTHRCLAERYKAPPKAKAGPPPPTPANATSSSGAGE